jgi:DnaJ-class molecular chaperone
MTEAWELEVIDCPRCGGTGETDFAPYYLAPEPCGVCGRSGRVTIQDWNRWRDYIYSLQSPEVKAAMDAEREAAVKAQREKLFTCPRCEGTGTFSLTTILRNGFNDDCVACRGTGRVTAQDWNAWCDYFERSHP